MPSQSIQNRIQDRIKDSVHKSRRKRWYQRASGRIYIVLGLFVIAVVVIFFIRANYYYQQALLTEGGLADAVASLKQEARIDLLHNGDDPSFGPDDALITVVAFEDFECPFCFAAQPFIKKIETIYGDDVRFIFKDFPLNAIHPRAQRAAEAAQCAYEQGLFWEFHDELYENQDRLAEAFYRTVARQIGMNVAEYNECFASGRYQSTIAQDLELGRLFNVVGTPTFFINGELFSQGYDKSVDEAFDKTVEFIKSL